MKKHIWIVAAMLVFGAAANSMAATDFDMILTAYGYKNADGVNQSGVSSGKTFGDNEASYNFGYPTDFSSGEELFGLGGANDGVTFDTGIFLEDLLSTGVDSWGDIQVAVYDSYGSPIDGDWAASYFTATGAPTLNTNQQTNFDSAHRNIALGAGIGDPDTSEVYGTGDDNSYVTRMNSGEIGKFSRMLTSLNGEANLGALDSDATVDLALYKAEFTTDVNGDDVYDTPVKLGTFTFSADGSDQLVADYSAGADDNGTGENPPDNLLGDLDLTLGEVGLGDVSVALRVAVGGSPSLSFNATGNDVDGDEAVGMAEAIYGLQFLAGMR